MHRTLLYATYGTLLVSGILHYIADVLSQYLRGTRAPGPETTLYYGLNTAYSIGQVVFALCALMIIRSGSTLMDSTGGIAISFAAIIGWLVFTFFFIEYTPPKVFIGVVLVLLIAATVVRG